MTRLEAIDRLNHYCRSRPEGVSGCVDCPIFTDAGGICKQFSERTDEELAESLIAMVHAGGATEHDDDLHFEADEIQTGKQMILVSRDDLNVMKGRLLMISSCPGVTITEKMADEILFMAEYIDSIMRHGKGAESNLHPAAPSCT